MNIYESITKIMAEVPAIGKEKTNKTQGFKYRGIDDVMNVLHDLLAKYKVFPVPQIMEQTREERQTSKGGILIYSICKIKYIFYAEDGTFIEAIVTGEGMDSGDKATNKAMAISMKYALSQIFCIPTEEIGNDDPDRESPEAGKKVEITISAQQARIVQSLMIQKGLNIEKLLMQNYGIDSTDKLTDKQYAQILAKVKDMPDKIQVVEE